MYTLRQTTLPGRTLGEGQRQSGRFHSNKHFHYYPLHLQQPGIYQIETHSALDTLCILMDERGKKIHRDDDSGSGSNCRLQKTLSPGRYLLAVRTFKKVGGDYQVSLSKKALPSPKPPKKTPTPQKPPTLQKPRPVATTPSPTPRPTTPTPQKTPTPTPATPRPVPMPTHS